ncbi:FAD-binding protein [Pseudonocardia nematodicida]|uniref:FAD-binding protein n=1 Tax=Pseudonocardia nematodicida TaxID=1206997 RepID=A0ABV1KH31_9PSEU
MDTTTDIRDVLTDRITGPVTAVPTSVASFQTGLAHQPAVVAVPTGTADVAAVLAVAAERDLPVTVHASGHGLRSPADGGLLLTTGRMAGVRIDPATRTARIGAGARWADVLAAAAPYGLRPPSGSAPSVGVAGYLSGGGLGLAARSDGWAADHLRSIDLVDAEGPRTVDAGSDPATFARLRGTGPVAGEVVTAVELGLLPSDGFTGGGLVRVLGPADEPGDPEPLHAWASWTADLPDEITSGASVVPYPDLPFLPPALRGRRVLRIGVTVLGGSARADALLAPLRAALLPEQDTVAPLDPVDSGRVYAEPEFPHAYLGDDLLLSGLDPAGLDTVVSRVGPMVVTGIRHLGGAAGRSPAVPDTVRGRGAGFLVGALAPFGPDAVPADRAWAGVDDVLDGFRRDATAEVSHPAFRFGPDRAS